MNKVEHQYKSPTHLNTRISIHSKYSTNKTNYYDWIFSHYDIQPGNSVLELGCGTGEIWKNHMDLLETGVGLTLTDFSDGMLTSTRENLGLHPGICYQTADIQHLSFPDDSFDVVIVNMMLHLVPDVAQGLSEVRRVLKPGGSFYCAAFGENGIHEYTAALLRGLGIPDKIYDSFTLQNGAPQLAPHFSSITRSDREDGLEITDIGDFADYMYSLASLSNVEKLPRDVLMAALEKRLENGILYVPKETGIFICK